MNESEVQLEVLEEHSDIYGHLNNAFHAQYFEKGRSALQELYGIGDAFLTERGYGLWVQDTYIHRMKQAKGGEAVVIHSHFLGCLGLFVYMHHRMVREETEIAFCISEHYFVRHDKNPTPIEIPDFFEGQIEPIPIEKGHLPGMFAALEYLENKKKEDRIAKLKEMKSKS